MYRNLKAEIVRENLKQKDIADFLGITRDTFYNKINGKTSFSLEEANKIRDKYFPEMEIEYLFEKKDN